VRKLRLTSHFKAGDVVQEGREKERKRRLGANNISRLIFYYYGW